MSRSNSGKFGLSNRADHFYFWLIRQVYDNRVSVRILIIPDLHNGAAVIAPICSNDLSDLLVVQLHKRPNGVNRNGV